MTNKHYWSLQKVAAVVAILTSSIGTACLFKENYFTKEVTWYIGEWVIDMEKSMPIFKQKRKHLEHVFNNGEIEEMNWPEPGADMRDARFSFKSTSGNMLRSGTSDSKTSIFHVNKWKAVELGFDTGTNSIIKYDLEVESKNKIRMTEVFKDYVVKSGLSSDAEPDSYLVRDGEDIIIKSMYYVEKRRCKLPDLNECKTYAEFIPTSYYLKRPD